MAAPEANPLADAYDAARALRERLTACRAAIGEAGHGADADVVAGAIAKHLATVTAAELPLAAQVVWRERIARPLKADAEKSLPARAVQAIRSWPSQRIGEVVTALAEIEALLIEAENDAHHEVIYAEISRAYS